MLTLPRIIEGPPLVTPLFLYQTRVFAVHERAPNDPLTIVSLPTSSLPPPFFSHAIPVTPRGGANEALRR